MREARSKGKTSLQLRRCVLLPQAGGSSRQLDRHVRFLSVRAPVDLDTNTDKTRTHTCTCNVIVELEYYGRVYR
jgi:hypothetical protein